MARTKYHFGFKFEGTRWTFVEDAPDKDYRHYVVVKCTCGVKKSVLVKDLRNAKSKSCGCLRSEVTCQRNLLDIPTKTSHWLYGRWHSMCQRCSNPNDPYYHCYGAKGITVCDEWKDFSRYAYWIESFQSMTPSSIFEVHRENSNLGYSPLNCVCLNPLTHRQIEKDLRWQHLLCSTAT